jgi:hypothetical protein
MDVSATNAMSLRSEWLICRGDYTFRYPDLKVDTFGERFARIRAGIVRNKEFRTSEEGQNN